MKYFEIVNSPASLSIVKTLLCFQVSTHGYSQNQILVWKYPSLVQIAKLTGHSYRVLYLVSPKTSRGGGGGSEVKS